MKINYYGKPKNTNRLWLSSQFKQASREVFKGIDTKDLVIDVDFDYEYTAAVHPLSDEYLDYNITLGKFADKDLLICQIIHELWHVRQYMLGHLRETNVGHIVRWRGKLHYYSKHKLEPWEVEAYYHERRIYSKNKGRIGPIKKSMPSNAAFAR